MSKNNTRGFLRYLKLDCCVVQLHIGPLGEPRINKILGGLDVFIACEKQGHRISMAKSVEKKILFSILNLFFLHNIEKRE